MPVPVRSVLVILLASLFNSPAVAQWTVTNLQAPEHGLTEAPGVWGHQQVGNTYIDSSIHAILWSGTAESWIDLNPEVAVGAGAYAVSDGRQVGYAYIPTTPGTAANVHAALWTGTPASFVDLAPAGAVHSQAWGVGDGQQVGEAVFSEGLPRASLWSGSAATWVDLSPAGSSSSRAYGTSEGQQVGVADGVASLWHGTASSWISLKPAHVAISEALAVHRGQQVGRVADFTMDDIFVPWNHASLWTGTAESWIDLNPPGAIESNAYAVYRGQQVGDANIGGELRAVLWNGTAESWVDLNEFLPPGFDYATATGIWSDDSVIYVSGHGGSRMTGSQYALLWTRPIPEPHSFLLLSLAMLGAVSCRSRAGAHSSRITR